MSKLIFVQDIDVRHSPKVRAEMRGDAVAEYAAIYKSDKKKLPSIVLFTEDGKRFLIADGAHRLQAQISNGVKTVIAEVKKGGYEEALSWALTANESHGIRRSREDKRQCVAEAIKQWPTLSNAQIAVACSVDDHTVKAVRDGMEEAKEIQPEPVRQSSDGRKTLANKPRSKSVSEIRDAQPKSEEPEKPKDPTGRVIPQFCIGYWNRTDEVKDLLKYISHVMSELKKANRDEDLMYSEVNITGTLADLDKAWTAIQTGIPYAVCTQCQGHPKGQCRLCKGRGLISKFKWDTSVPAELKQVLKVQAK